MQVTATTLATLINEYKPLLLALPETALLPKPAPGKWSRKEIIGHLVDSAQTNIRRFIVSQYEDTPYIVYNQDQWVSIVNYQQWKNEELIELWYLLNKQICMILQTMSPTMAQRKCQTQAIHTIEWLAADYIRHLQHHMHVILDREPIPY